MKCIGKMRRFVSFILCLSLMAVMYITAYCEDFFIPVFNLNTAYETEQAYIYDDALISVEDDRASGGTVYKTNKEYQASASDIKGPMLSFNVYSSERVTNCKLYVKYISTYGSTSFFYRINGGSWTCVYPGEVKEYTWFEVPYLSITLEEGNTLIEFAQRVSGFTLDMIKITCDDVAGGDETSGEEPDDGETDEEENLPVFELDTAYETEQGYVYGNNMKLVDDGNASGGKALMTSGEGYATAADVKEPMLAFKVNANAETKDCKLMIRYIYKPGSTSFYYKIGDASDWTVTYPPKQTEYVWYEIPYLKFDLKKGSTTIQLAQRTGEFKIDQIKIVGGETIGEEPEESLPTFNLDVAYETEQGYVYGTNMKLVDDANASGGKTLITNGEFYATAADVKEPMLAFNVNSPDGAKGCKLMIRYIHKPGSTSFYYKVGNASDWTVTYPPKQTEYVWYEIPYLNFDLPKGSTTIQLAQRTGEFKIDQIKIVGESKDYAEPAVSEGIVTYPQTMKANTINTVPAFEDGDTVLFIGDSITHGELSGNYLAYLSNFYAGRFPGKNIRYLNKAIGGNDANEAIARWNYDIFNGMDAPVNKAVILLGTNDMEMANYYVGTENYHGEKNRREVNLLRYEINIRALVTMLRNKGIEDIILISPPIYDEWGSTQSAILAQDFNDISRKIGALQYRLSGELEDVYFVDINTPMTIVDYYNKITKNQGFRLSPDRVHPNETANWIIAYSILKAQGFGPELARVDIDAAKLTSDTYNASVSELSSVSGGIKYTYTPNALPLAADNLYRAGDELVPLTNELNREIICVKGLDDGVYDININGSLVMRADASQLKEGINIADKKNNPGQETSLKVLNAALKRIKHDAAHRTFHYSVQNYILDYGFDSTDRDKLIASIEKYVATASGSSKTTMENLLTKLYQEKSTLAESKSYEDSVISMSVPQTCTVEITLSSDQSEPGELKYAYKDVILPQDTVAVIPVERTPGISAERIVFTDESGKELTDLPASGTVTATTKVRNNSLEKSDAVLWLTSYGENGADVCGFADKITVLPGKEAEVSKTVTLSEASKGLKAGIWENSNKITPLMASGTCTSDNYGIKEVYINDRKIEFDPKVYNYTYVLAKEENYAPVVNIVAEDMGADIKITQASSVKDSAVIKAGDTTYTINFKISEPRVSKVKINNIVFEDFVPDVYYYELPKSSMGTVSAIAGYDVEVSVAQPTSSNPEAVITTEAPDGEKRKYTIRFIDRDVGVVSNIKWKGSAAPSSGNNRVVALQSKSVKLKNYYDVDMTYEEILQKLRSEEAYEDIDCAMYSTSYRSPVGMWDVAENNIYGYQLQFMYADVGGTFLQNPNVTRLLKPDTDINSTYISQGADPSRIYEFTISKPATVYIPSVARSTYIEGLGKGWTYENDISKYTLYTPSYNDVLLSDGKKLRIPTGATTYYTPFREGNVYYKHFNAGDNVEIPAYSATSSSRRIEVFIVWDEVHN